MRKNSLVAPLTRRKMSEPKWKLGSGLLRLKSSHTAKSKTSNSTFLQFRRTSLLNPDQTCQHRRKILLISPFTRQRAKGLSLGQILEQIEIFAPKLKTSGSEICYKTIKRRYVCPKLPNTSRKIFKK